ncbi:MAG: type IV secretion protein IcmC [Gammaproteobacteria bacterium]|nr:type IV secretion protein IcmC [Gammaproteobacteria bacterium]MCH9744092.1 type IV secretion protein IcmC [Gammaproteobacteria bacterium]
MAGDPTIIGQNIATMGDILQSLSVFFGVCMCIGGFFKLKHYGESRTQMSQQQSLIAPVAFLMCGIGLLILPTVLGTFLNAFWQTSNPLTYGGLSWDSIDQYIPDVLIFVRVIGVAAFIRGIFHLSRAGGHQGQPGTIGKALMHIGAGILCIHVLGVVELIKSILDLA